MFNQESSVLKLNEICNTFKTQDLRIIGQKSVSYLKLKKRQIIILLVPSQTYLIKKTFLIFLLANTNLSLNVCSPGSDAVVINCVANFIIY